MSKIALCLNEQFEALMDDLLVQSKFDHIFSNYKIWKSDVDAQHYACDEIETEIVKRFFTFLKKDLGNIFEHKENYVKK